MGALPDDPGFFPAPTLGSTQTSATPGPENLMQSYIPVTDTHIIDNLHINKSKMKSQTK